MDSDQGKLYLIFWCSPNRTPEFETSYLEDYGKVFATEVRVQGFQYVGRGVSATEEGSKNNAAIHYLMHLIRDGLLDKESVARRVPCLPLGIHPNGTFDPSPLPNFLEPVTDKSFDKHSISPRKDLCDESVSHNSMADLDARSKKSTDSRNHGNIQEYVPLQVLVPRQAVENVVGTDGNIIKRIEVSNGVKITFPEKSNDDDLMGRIFTLTGEYDKVQAAALTINKIIQWSLIKAANSLQQVIAFGDENVKSAIDIVKNESPVRNESIIAFTSGNAESKKHTSRSMSATDQPAQGLMKNTASSAVSSMKISIPAELVGRAIGVGGANLKRIKKETGAKVKFDDKVDDKGCRSCEITGTQESIATAVKEINLVIRGDGKIGNLSSTDQQTRGSETAVDSKDVLSMKISIPQELVGLAIGTDGVNIKRVEKETGVKIQFDQKTDDKGCKTCEITGASENVAAAVKEINLIIKPGNQKTGNLPATSQQTQVSTTAAKPVSPKKISVRSEIVGLVIGQGGANIKRIIEETGAKIQFDQTVNDKGCKTCEISGTLQSIEAAVKEIKSMIGLNAEDTDEIATVSQIPIPEEVFGFVTGKNNITINHVAAKAGVKIFIPKKQKNDKSGVKRCVISGKPDGVESAARRVNALINIGVRNVQATSSVAKSVQTPEVEQPITASQHSSSTIELLVPVDMIESVKGKDGAIIKQISQDTWTQIIFHESDETGNLGTIKCIISGASPNILTAARRINALINVGVMNKVITPASHQPSAPSSSIFQQSAPSVPSSSVFGHSTHLVSKVITPTSQQCSMPSSSIFGQSPPSVPSSSIFGMSSQLGSKTSTSQENVHRMSIIDELQQKLLKKNKDTWLTSQENSTSGTGDFLLKSQQKIKTILPKPQRNWYRMAISSSHNKSSEGYEFVLQPSLEKEIDNILAAMNVTPKATEKNSTLSYKPSLNMLSSGKITTSQPDIVMRWWSPPQKNWDPWLKKNIDEPPLSEMSLEQISSHLMTAHFSQIQNDEKLQNNMKQRNNVNVRHHQHQILHAVKRNPITIIHGPSGSGKSTQVPQYIFDSYLNLGHAAECCILVAQPRHITAIATAKRIAEERCEELGNSIGYEVSFQSCLPRPYGCILYCTLDVLLKRLEGGIRGVSHIILDEIHERNAKSDFAMAILRDMVEAFPSMRVILMSATMDLKPIKNYFPSCVVVEVPLKTHPVQDYFLEDIIQMLGCLPPPKQYNEETEYCDHLDDNEDIKQYESTKYSFCMNGSLMKGVSFELIIELLKYIKSLNVIGSILVFLPDCNTVSTLLRCLLNHPVFDISSHWFVPLHSEISPEQMDDVFQPAPSGVTKIILSTSIAETAVTPRDVVYVIDTCKTVIRQFSSNKRSINYTIALTTKYSLEQRSRQASFIQPGFCFHLCSHDCYNKLKNDIIPEIQHTSLHEIILSIKLLRLGNSKQFLSKLLKPPSTKAILEAEELLDELGALDKNGNLTPLGKILARLPVEPQLGKMIILGCLFFLGDLSCLLAAHQSVHPQSSSPNLEKFIGYRCSDHIAFVNAFIQWQMMQTKEEKKKEFFSKHNLQSHSLELVYNMKIQLKEMMKSMGFPDDCLAEKPLFLTDHDSDVDVVVALLVMGLYPHICFHKESKAASELQTDLATSFNSPFFVFGRKICTEEATYKNMTMISVSHLLLFGSRSIELLDKTKVDSWINLKMDPKLVSKLVSMRSALEITISDVACNPRSLQSLSTASRRLLSVTKALCTEACEESRTADQHSIVADAADMEPPNKIQLLSSVSSNADYTWTKDHLNENFYGQHVQKSLNNSPFGKSMLDCNRFSDQRLITDYNRLSNPRLLPDYNKPSDPRLSPDYNPPSDPRLKHRNNNEHCETRLITGQRGKNRSSKVCAKDSDYFQKRDVACEMGRISTFLVDRSDSDYYQRHTVAQDIDKFRTATFQNEEINRSRKVSEPKHKNDSGYWGHGL